VARSIFSSRVEQAAQVMPAMGRLKVGRSVAVMAAGSG
jgi:hypothetical protein